MLMVFQGPDELPIHVNRIDLTVGQSLIDGWQGHKCWGCTECGVKVQDRFKRRDQLQPEFIGLRAWGECFMVFPRFMDRVSRARLQ